MNKNKKKRSRSTFMVLMCIISLLVVITSAIFTVLLVHYRSRDLIESADARLLLAGEFAREMIGPSYHDTIVDATSVSKEQFRKIVARNDDLCRRLNLQYLWSVLVVGDRLVFTSATHSDLHAPESPCASFFETHRNPDSFAPAMGPDPQPSFSSFHNEWGEGRQVLIPRRDARGRTYIFGASVQLKSLNAIARRTTLTSIWIGAGVICSAFLLALVLARSFTAPIAKLTEAAGRMATGDLDVTLAPVKTRELQFLAKSLDEMRLGLKQQLASLQQSEALLAQSQQIANIGSWNLDAATNRLIWSAETYRIFGLAQQEFAATYEAFLSTVLPEDRPAVEAAYAASLLEGKDSYEIEHRIVRGTTGEIRHVYEKCVHERNAAGAIIRSVGMVQDITERRRFEEALRESEETARAMLNASADAVSLIDRGGKILAVNAAMAARLGKPQEDIVGKSIYAAFPAMMHAPMQANIDQVVQSGESLRLEDAHSGSILDVIMYPVFDGSKKVSRMAIFARDITAQRQAEDALRASLEQLRAYFNLPLIGIATTNFQQGWLDINHRLCSMLGYEEAELRAKKLADLNPEGYSPPERSLYDDFLQGKTDFPFSYERQYLKKDGAILHALVSTDVIRDAGGSISRFVSFVQDITERKQAEDALQLKNEELIRFNYTVSHDLKSPLVTIKTFLGYLGQDLARADTEHVAKDLGYIHTAADKMNCLLEELLDLSRIGRIVKTPVDARVQDIVQEALDLVAGRIAQRGVRVKVTEEPALVCGDRSRLVEVFQNLIDNAAKFMGEQPEPLIEIGARAAQGAVELFVRDNGIGIDPRHKEKLFGLFEKLSSGTEGSGMGLALARRIVEAHGGRVWAESEGVGKGACFWVSLPCKPVQG